MSTEIIINGEKVTVQKFNEMMNDPKVQIRRIEGTANEYKTYDRIMG